MIVRQPELVKVIEDGVPQKVIQIDCGRNFSVAITDQRKVFTWLDNTFG